MIPILQRFALAARADQSSRVGCTRVLVLLPTRELCVQVFAVFKKLSADIDNCEVACAAGGLDLQQQTAALRRDPDILGMGQLRVIVREESLNRAFYLVYNYSNQSNLVTSLIFDFSAKCNQISKCN